jgi:uncharacterized membrane protein
MTLQRCNRCGTLNPRDARFCTECGVRLTPDVQPIEDEISQLREQISRISYRLDALEGSQGIEDEIRQLRVQVSVINQHLDALQERAQTAAKQAAPAAPSIEPKTAPAQALTPAQETTPEPITDQAGEPQAEVKVRQPAKPREWEQILGRNWLARIGVLALIIGIGFFLKYAFDNNWLGPSARVILGTAAGLVMLWLGFHWRKRYPIMTQVLSGGGIAVLYLSIFASFATYDLISIYIAVLLLLLTSILSTILALRYNSMALAVIGIIGAFFAPYILGAFGRSGLEEGTRRQAIQLLTYIIVVDIGVLLLSALRNWRWFILLAFSCSMITYGVWYGQLGDRVGIAIGETGITIIFLSFIGATFLYYFIRHRTPQAFDYFLMVLNAAAYAAISRGLMWDDFRPWMGGFNLLLAIFYGILAYLAYRRSAGNTRLAAFTLAIGLIFLTVTIPVQFRNHATTTIAWAAEGAVLMWLASREKIKIFRYESYIVFALVAIRLLGFDTWVRGNNVTPIFNERFLAFVVSIAMMWLAAFLLWKRGGEQKYPDHLFFIAAADFFTVWIIGAEVFGYSNQALTTSNSLSLLILLIPAATVIWQHIIWRRQPSTFDSALAVFAAALAIISVFLWDYLRAWMGMTYFVLAILYGTMAVYSLKKKADYSTLGAVTLVTGIVFLTTAIAVQFGDHAPTTITWAIEMAALVWLSFALKIPLLRYCGYVVFIVMVLRLIAFDTTLDTNNFKPIINARFLAFVIGIAAIYLTVFILWRQRDVATPVFLIAASFLTVWIVSFEVWQSFSSSIRNAEPGDRRGLENAQNLSLTGVWALYAVAGLVVGIWRKWRYVRIGSLALLAIPIIKVFVYDVFHLETSYRIGAFVGLGLLLLASAYLYQRYSNVIKGVFTKK